METTLNGKTHRIGLCDGCGRGASLLDGRCYDCRPFTYEDAKAAQFATGSCPDGYFGERRRCWFARNPISGGVVVGTDAGYFRAAVPPALSDREALWLLTRHPEAHHAGYRID